MPAQPVTQNYNTQQIFLGDNWDRDVAFTNPNGAPLTILAGTVLGIIFATNLALPSVAAAVDGSEAPRGFVRETVTFAANASGLINMVNTGAINQNAIIFANGVDTLATNVGAQGTGGTMLDLINANTRCQLVPSIELSIVDPNQ